MLFCVYRKYSPGSPCDDTLFFVSRGLENLQHSHPVISPFTNSFPKPSIEPGEEAESDREVAPLLSVSFLPT